MAMVEKIVSCEHAYFLYSVLQCVRRKKKDEDSGGGGIAGIGYTCMQQQQSSQLSHHSTSDDISTSQIANHQFDLEPNAFPPLPAHFGEMPSTSSITLLPDPLHIISDSECVRQFREDRHQLNWDNGYIKIEIVYRKLCT